MVCAISAHPLLSIDEESRSSSNSNTAYLHHFVSLLGRVLMTEVMPYLIRFPYTLSGVLKLFSCFETGTPCSSKQASTVSGSVLSSNSLLEAMHRSRKFRAGIKPFGLCSMQMVPPVITTSTRASGVLTGCDRMDSGES